VGAAGETLGRKSGSWSRTSLLWWVARVARRVAGVMPWVSWVALLSRIAGIAGVAPAIRGSWRARLGAVAGARPLAARSTSSRALWSSPLTTGAPLGRRRRLQGRLHVPHRVDWGVPIRAAVVALALDAPKPFRVGLSSIAWSSLVAREAGVAWMLPCRSSSVGTPCSWWSSLTRRRSSSSPSLVIARKPLTSIL